MKNLRGDRSSTVFVETMPSAGCKWLPSQSLKRKLKTGSAKCQMMFFVTYFYYSWIHMKRCIQLYILSKKWNNFWTSLPNLESYDKLIFPYVIFMARIWMWSFYDISWSCNICLFVTQKTLKICLSCNEYYLYDPAYTFFTDAPKLGKLQSQFLSTSFGEWKICS